jgi:hypothetical protein
MTRGVGATYSSTTWVPFYANRRLPARKARPSPDLDGFLVRLRCAWGAELVADAPVEVRNDPLNVQKRVGACAALEHLAVRCLRRAVSPPRIRGSNDPMLLRVQSHQRTSRCPLGTSHQRRVVTAERTQMERVAGRPGFTTSKSTGGFMTHVDPLGNQSAPNPMGSSQRPRPEVRALLRPGQQQCM